MNIHTVSGGLLDVNTYVVEGETACLVFDPGVPTDRVLRETHGKPVEAVLLTHGHVDHVMYLEDWAKQGIPIYIHEADTILLADPDWNLSVEFGKHLTFPAPSVKLQGGETLHLAGLEIEVLSTPGHTQGSVCYRIGDTLISGDTLFEGSYGRTDFPGGNPAEMVASLRRLKALPEQTAVYPGHGSATTIARERQWRW